MIDIFVIQPPYLMEDNCDEKISNFLLSNLKEVKENSLVVLPEYSNAGGLSKKEDIMLALKRAEVMKKEVQKIAKEKSLYAVINVVEKRNGKLKNASYLYGKEGEEVYVYDKIHLPPSEINLGVERGNGDCVCDYDGIRFAFLTCYDVYFNEQIEKIALSKPDVIIVSSYQRGERVDILEAQAKLIAFRCNAYLVRASYSMGSEKVGGNSMIVSPDGIILENIKSNIGVIKKSVDLKYKYLRSAGFGGNQIRNDDFISNGIQKDLFI